MEGQRFESAQERKQEAENSSKDRGFRLFLISEKSLLIDKWYVSISMKINQSKNCYEYMEQLRFYDQVCLVIFS